MASVLYRIIPLRILRRTTGVKFDEIVPSDIPKIDGIDRDNNCLIEHKNRVNELFERIPSYEKVQLEIYMHITKLGSCKLIQTHFEDTSELVFEPSVKRWKKIKFALIKCIQRIHELMKDPEDMKRFMSKYRKYL